mmetsp:Transcript_6163/g.8919  ORF Transcript_6163/g.8919 Transcript_6163/m.8919 type:complete len:297 (-) Transcript_6163:529-1419(-)|eukprot:CAMPEP_0195515032 /NCGR_PEP_ID=MMETSP0794_2-20130614/6248_1 /TAXON_ID=515487 /ORGANISM="Stephanopyxis turris, Strain CCMP 815" /LENGTH=296 /DNA_ID=CAMNT_0040643411 /DNA_START=85 /DNA_END=975 /DNA_ORIENTATION=+
MSGGIDYSKWDNVECDSSDDEEVYSHPHVTCLDEPSTVTRSTDGTLSVSASSNKQSTAASNPVTLSTVQTPSLSKSKDTNKKSSEESPNKSRVLTKNGGEFVDSTTKSHIRWSQNRDEVIISIAYDPNSITHARDFNVKLTGALPFEDRHSAVGDHASKGSLLVSVKRAASEDGGKAKNENVRTLLNGELPHFVHLDEDGEEAVEWEIDSCEYHGITIAESGKETKLIRITLRKAVPMQGVSIWWSQPLLHCPTIDVNDIEDRRNDTGGMQDMKSNWDEAHRMFLERVKSRKKTEV